MAATQTAMPARDGLVVGYATPPEHAYEAALVELRELLDIYRAQVTRETRRRAA